MTSYAAHPEVQLKTIEEIIHKNSLKSSIEKSKIDIKNLIIHERGLENPHGHYLVGGSLPVSRKNSIKTAHSRLSIAPATNYQASTPERKIPISHQSTQRTNNTNSNNNRESQENINQNNYIKIKRWAVDGSVRNIEKKNILFLNGDHNNNSNNPVVPKKTKRRTTEAEESLLLIGNNKVITQPVDPTPQESQSSAELANQIRSNEVSSKSKLNKTLNTFLLKLNIIEHPFGNIPHTSKRNYKIVCQPEPVQPIYSVLPPRPRKKESSVKNNSRNEGEAPVNDEDDSLRKNRKKAKSTSKKLDKIPDFIMFNLDSIPQTKNLTQSKPTSRIINNSLSTVDRKASSQTKFWKKEYLTRMAAKPNTASNEQENDRLRSNAGEFNSIQPHVSELKLMSKDQKKQTMQKTTYSFRSGKKSVSVKDTNKKITGAKKTQHQICGWGNEDNDLQLQAHHCQF